MEKLCGIDLKRAQLVPSSVFTSPDEVVASGRLSLPQKLAILRRWEFDARRTAGFGPVGIEGSMLSRIQRSLRTLTVEVAAQPERPVAEYVALPPLPGFAPVDDAAGEEIDPAPASGPEQKLLERHHGGDRERDRYRHGAARRILERVGQ